MTPNQIYNLTPIWTEHDLHPIRDAFREVHVYDIPQRNREPKEIELKYYARHNYDGDRHWTLFSVWFKGKPFMLCRSAGKDDGYDEKFITDLTTYKTCVVFLVSLIEAEFDDEKDNVIDPDVENKNITEFYNCKLEHFYQEGIEIKYSIGDIVTAMVPENHTHYSPNKMVPTRVQIDRIEPFSPHMTYRGKQIDRRWSEDHRNIIFDKDNGRIYASFGNDDVVSPL